MQYTMPHGLPKRDNDEGVGDIRVHNNQLADATNQALNTVLSMAKLWAESYTDGTTGSEASRIGSLEDSTQSLVSATSVLASRLTAVEQLGGLAPGDLSDATMADIATNDQSTFYAAQASAIVDKLPWVNVLDHGAVPDGWAEAPTDNKPFLDAAIAQIRANGGGTLYFPPGAYWWPQIVRVADDMHITGDGATIVKRFVTDNNYAMFVSQSKGQQGYGAGVRNLRVSRMHFRGSFAAEGSTACAFAFNHADDVLIEFCTFQEMQNIGHTIDMGGSQNITIRDCIFAGSKNTSTGDGRWAEAIQCDISAAGAASTPDDPGSWSGLPCKNIVVENCKFWPLTIDGITYPAPNPLGSHARRENAWHEGIRFIGNEIVDPYLDTVSGFPGTIHFVCARDIWIERNIWRLSVPATLVAIGLYSIDRGTSSMSDNEAGAVNPTVDILPMAISDVTIRGNRFYGWGGGPDRGIIQVLSHSANTGMVKARSIKGSDNKATSLATSGSTSLFKVDGASGVRWSEGSSTGTLRTAYILNSNNVRVRDPESSETSAVSVWLTAVRDFQILGGQLYAAGSLPAIRTNSSCSNGLVTQNIVTGNSTKPLDVLGTNVSEKDNMIIPS